MQNSWSPCTSPCYVTKGEFIAPDGVIVPFQRFDRHLRDVAADLMHKNIVKYHCLFFPYGFGAQSTGVVEDVSTRLAIQIKYMLIIFSFIKFDFS
jgi:hypothetical protein